MRLAWTPPLIVSLALCCAVLGACDSGSDAEESTTEVPETSSDDEDDGGCPTGQTICDGACTDLNTDAANCGSCGFACVEGGSCESAMCIAACDAPELSCGGMCVDVSSSDEHCGDCDDPCAPGLHCEDSMCACGDPVSFATDVAPLIADGCTNEDCHDSVEPDAELDLMTDSYAALVDMATTQCGGNAVRVSPGSVGGSYLMNKLLGDEMCQGERMPRGEDPLSDADLAKVANWICHGAAND